MSHPFNYGSTYKFKNPLLDLVPNRSEKIIFVANNTKRVNAKDDYFQTFNIR